MNFVNTLFNSMIGAHSSTALNQTLSVAGAAIAVHTIWRRWVRRLTRILTTTAVLVITAILFSHPDVFTVSPAPPGPSCCAAFHE